MCVPMHIKILNFPRFLCSILEARRGGMYVVSKESYLASYFEMWVQQVEGIGKFSS